MQKVQQCVLGLALLMAVVPAVWGQESLAPIVPLVKQVTQQQVVDLGDILRDLPDARDNPFLYDELAANLQTAAHAMVGGETDVVVFVRRVTRREVEVEVRQPGKARYALLHATPPDFGSLGTVDYEYPWRSQSFHLFAEPVGLRIGSEISLELARKLRHADLLLIRGRIRAMPVETRKSVFNPWIHVILADWKVVEVYDESTGAVFAR